MNFKWLDVFRWSSLFGLFACALPLAQEHTKNFIGFAIFSILVIVLNYVKGFEEAKTLLLKIMNIYIGDENNDRR